MLTYHPSIKRRVGPYDEKYRVLTFNKNAYFSYYLNIATIVIVYLFFQLK